MRFLDKHAFLNKGFIQINLISKAATPKLFNKI